MTENINKTIHITLPDGSVREAPTGTTLLDFSMGFESRPGFRFIAARVNNDIRELTFVLNEDCRLAFVDISDEDGMRIYRRSLCFILIKAVHDLFPGRKVVVSHTISKGIFIEVNGETPLSEQEVHRIELRMHELVDRDIPFVKRVMSVEEAKDIFMKTGRPDRFHAIEYRKKSHVSIYSCEGFDDYFYGYMVPSTGYLNIFALKFREPGLVMLFPEGTRPGVLPVYSEQKKLFNIFMEYKHWNHVLGIDNVGDLNDLIQAGQVYDIIRVSEALHEKKIAYIADSIAQNPDKKLVLISGPSSSGKTTFAHRLAIQLRVNGLRPVTISLDDYFVDRDHTPIDENGEYDYEALEAIDLKLFNQQLADLIAGREAEIPIFNFSKGSREGAGRKLKIDSDQVLVIEGIHGLNERLTATIPAEKKFKIYVSALTSMNIDDHNRISSTDSRLIRRIVRDFQFRGSSAVNTIKRWPSVRRGEEKNIFPYQENADVMFNSTLVYEKGVLRKLAEPLLVEVESKVPEYSEAHRLIEFLSYFLPIEVEEIPANSIIREFLGGSCFY